MLLSKSFIKLSSMDANLAPLSVPPPELGLQVVVVVVLDVTRLRDLVGAVRVVGAHLLGH